MWGCSDASYESDSGCMRGRSGYVLFSGGATARWGRKAQDIMSMSNMEVEYMAISQAVQEHLCLRMLQANIGIEVEM